MTPSTPPDALSLFVSEAQAVLARHPAGGAGALGELAALARRRGLCAEEVHEAGGRLRLDQGQAAELLRLAAEPGGRVDLFRAVLGVAASLLLLGVTTVLLLFLVWQEREQQAPATGPAAVKSSAAEKPAGQLPGAAVPGLPPVEPPVPEFVPDAGLLQAVAAAQRLLPSEAGRLERLKLADPAARATAWRDLLPRLPDLLAREDAAGAVASLLAGYYAQEEEGNAAQIRSAIVGLLPADYGQVPADVTALGRYFWGGRLAAVAVHHPDVPPARADQLWDGVRARVAPGLQLGPTAGATGQAVNAEVVSKLAETLVGLATADPSGAAQQLERLTQAAEGHVAPGLTVAVRSRFQAAVNPAPPPAEVAAGEKGEKDLENVNKPGGGGAPPGDPRVEQLAAVAAKLCAQELPGPDADPVAVLKAAANFTFTATLLTALDGKKEVLLASLVDAPPRLDAYLEQLRREDAAAGGKGDDPPTWPPMPIPELPPPDPMPGAVPSGPALPLGDREMTDHAVRAVEVGRHAQVRYEGLKYIAETSKVKDLPPHQAEAVAAYVLARATPAEVQAALPLLPRLSRFPSVPVAFADVLEDRPVSPAVLQAVVSQLAGRPVRLDTDGEWRHQARKLLLEAGLSTGSPSPEADAVERMFRDLYQKQAEAMGVVAADVDTAAAAMARLAEGLAAQAKLDDGSGPMGEAARDRRLLRAGDFLADNDLGRTAVAQQALVRLLAARVARHHPERAETARAVREEFESRSAAAATVVQQLWLGEQYLLRLRVLAVGGDWTARGAR